MRALSLAMVLLLGAVSPCWGQGSTAAPKNDNPAGGSASGAGAGLGSSAGGGGAFVGGGRGSVNSGAGLGGSVTITGGLDELLGQALKANPDLRVAESKLREAEAEFNRVRMQIMQKVVKLEFDLKDAKERVAQLSKRIDRIKQLQKEGTVSVEVFATAEADLLAAKSSLARFEGELPFLLGKQPQSVNLFSGFDMDGAAAIRSGSLGMLTIDSKQNQIVSGTTYGAGGGFTLTIPAATGSTTEKIRKAFDAPIALKYQDAPLDKILDDFRRFKGINLVVNAKDANKEVNFSIDLAEPVPFGAALQWLEDQSGLRFVIREYGIVGAPQAKLPPGAIGVVEFWRTGRRSSATQTSGGVMGGGMSGGGGPLEGAPSAFETPIRPAFGGGGILNPNSAPKQ
jgi:hypothetical protein